MDEGLRAPEYVRRVVDGEIDALVAGGAAAISLEGAKAVGKSATGAERATTVFLLEIPAQRQALEADPNLVRTAGPVLIDEWQHVPTTWDVVRRAVDRGATPGQFVLTGSTAGTHRGTHSGAGRILSVPMRPMTLPERGLDEPTVSLADLLGGTRASIGGATTVGLARYVAEITGSGFPGIHTLGEPVRTAQLRGYLTRVIDRDYEDATGRAIRNPAALRRWLAAYAAATSTTASFETIRDAATAGQGDKPAKTTTIAYRDALEALHLLDPVPAWLPSSNRISALAAAPKHHLVDPALATTLLGVGDDALIRPSGRGRPLIGDGSLLGATFESLVTLSVRVFAQAAGAETRHLRTHGGAHEIDLIVERPDGRVVALEVKLTQEIKDEHTRHLHWLTEHIGDRLLDAVVVTTGPAAYRRTDGIAVVPAALLGP